MGDEALGSGKSKGGGFDQNWLPAVTIESTRGEHIPLVVGSGRSHARARAILNAVVGIVLGVCIFWLGSLIVAIFSGRTSDFILLGGISLLMAAGGCTFGYLNWIVWNRGFYLRVNSAGLEIAYVGFNRPMFVPREMVRVVSVDEMSGPGQRFPIYPNGAVVRGTPETQRSPAPTGFSASSRDPYASPFGDSTTTSDKGPHEAGWAAPLQTSQTQGPISNQPQKTEFLYSHMGPRGASGVPFLRLNHEDIPNVAIIFHQNISTPRAPIGVDFPGYRAYGGGRKVPGVMMTVVDAARAQAAFSDWKVVREVTSQDVFEEGLFRPRRVNTSIRAALAAVGLVVAWVVRILLDLDDFGLM